LETRRIALVESIAAAVAAAAAVDLQEESIAIAQAGSTLAVAGSVGISCELAAVVLERRIGEAAVSKAQPPVQHS
jgi:hypothetical protein